MSALTLRHLSFFLVMSFFVTPLYADCKIVSVSSSSFGTVTTQNNVSNYHLADITVSCNQAYLLGIDGGSHLTSTRHLAHSDNTLIPYTLFQNANNIEWGSQGIVAANPYPKSPLSSNGSASTVVYSLYAEALTKDKVPQGAYSDTVTFILAAPDGTLLHSSTVNFTLNLVAFCTLNASKFADFGSYAIHSPRRTHISLGTITVTCPTTIQYKIGINKGQHLSGGMRRMALADLSAFVPYVLRYNTTEWGDNGIKALDSSYNETFATAPAVLGTGTGSPQNFTIYGDAWVEMATSVGTYTDTLIVTLVW